MNIEYLFSQWRCYSNPHANKALILQILDYALFGLLEQKPYCLIKMETFSHNKTKHHNYASETLHFY